VKEEKLIPRTFLKKTSSWGQNDPMVGGSMANAIEKKRGRWAQEKGAKGKAR